MKTHTYTCLDCGEEYASNTYRPHERRLCLNCAAKRVGDCATQLREKSGPYYDKWKAACEAKASRYLAGVKGE